MAIKDEEVLEVLKSFPKPCAHKFIQSGFNFIYNGKTYSFYYPNKGFPKVVSDGVVRIFTKGKELSALHKFLKPIEKTQPTQILGTGTNKAQLCIDHIEAKKTRVDADLTRENTRVSNMLGHLIDELKQYL